MEDDFEEEDGTDGSGARLRQWHACGRLLHVEYGDFDRERGIWHATVFADPQGGEPLDQCPECNGEIVEGRTSLEPWMAAQGPAPDILLSTSRRHEAVNLHDRSPNLRGSSSNLHRSTPNLHDGTPNLLKGHGGDPAHGRPDLNETFENQGANVLLEVEL